MRQIAASSLPAHPSSRGLRLRWTRRASNGRHEQDLVRVNGLVAYTQISHDKLDDANLLMMTVVKIIVIMTFGRLI